MIQNKPRVSRRENKRLRGAPGHIIGHAMHPEKTRKETAELSAVDFEIFGQSYRVHATESHPRDLILQLVRYVDSKMHSVLDQSPGVTALDVPTREYLAVIAALDIAEEYHLAKAALEESERTVQPRLENRDRRAHHYNVPMSESFWRW